MTEHLEIIMKEMCARVEADYDSLDFKDDDDRYFMKYEWNKEQEQAFVTWMADYLYENEPARREVMNNPRKNKKNCEKAAGEFAWNHGWRSMTQNA